MDDKNNLRNLILIMFVGLFLIIVLVFVNNIFAQGQCTGPNCGGASVGDDFTFDKGLDTGTIGTGDEKEGSEKLYYTPKTEGDTSGSNNPSEWHVGQKSEKDKPVPDSSITQNLKVLSENYKTLWEDSDWKKQQVERVNEHFKTEKFTKESDLTGYKIKGDGKTLIDPKGKEQDISKMENAKDVKSITTTEKGIILEDSGGGKHFLEAGTFQIKPLDPSIAQQAADAAAQRGPGGSPGGGGGGDGGGGGASGSGGDAQQKFQQALQAFGQISGILQQLAAAIKPQGESSASSSGSNAQIGLSNGAEAYLTSKDKEALLSQENASGKESLTNVNKDLSQLISSDNTQIVIPNQAVVHIPTGTPATEISNQGIESDPYSIASLTNSGTGSSSASSGNSSITGAVIFAAPNQFVKLINHNLALGGERIIVDLLKSFNEVDAEGNNLVVNNGKTKIEFLDRKTFYPRTIRETPHNMLKITNKLDNSNYFKLRNYKDENNYLVDGRKIISVGDEMIPHPKIKGLKIAEIREEMWKK